MCGAGYPEGKQVPGAWCAFSTDRAVGQLRAQAWRKSSGRMLEPGNAFSTRRSSVTRMSSSSIANATNSQSYDEQPERFASSSTSPVDGSRSRLPIDQGSFVHQLRGVGNVQ